MYGNNVREIIKTNSFNCILSLLNYSVVEIKPISKKKLHRRTCNIIFYYFLAHK